MQTYRLANANSSVIAVTSTATLLSALIDTAGATTHDFWSNLDAAMLVIEDGDIRANFGGNTPTAAKGILMKQGSVHNLRHIRLDQLRLISVSGSNVSVSVQVGRTDPGETSTVGSQGGSIGGTGADTAIGVVKVEERFTYDFAQADKLVKSGAGLLHTLTFSCNDAAPTAGSIIVYDNTAESGNVIFNHTFTTTPFVPFTITLDVLVATGIYIGFTTTNDVNVSTSYR